MEMITYNDAEALDSMLDRVQDNCKLFGWKGISGFDVWKDEGVYISIEVRKKSDWNKNKAKIKKLFKNVECGYLDKEGNCEGFVFWKLT